jgi:hypothetical protein
MRNTETLNTKKIIRILQHPEAALKLPSEEQKILILKGALLSLKQEASPEAISALYEVCTNSSLHEIVEASLFNLAELARNGTDAAADKFISALIQIRNIEEIKSYIDLTPHIIDSDLKAAFLFISNQIDGYAQFDQNYEMLARYFNIAHPNIRKNILSAAKNEGFAALHLILTTFFCQNDPDFEGLIEYFKDFDPPDKKLALELLQNKAMLGSLNAQDSLCRLFINYDDHQSQAIAMQNNYTPTDPVLKACFLFLSGLWTEYDLFDFDHSLISSAFRTMPQKIRKRLLDQSRLSGNTQWLQSVQAKSAQHFSTLSDLDWQNLIRQSLSGSEFSKLWNISFLAPPYWTVQALTKLEKYNWMPEDKNDEIFFRSILEKIHNTSLTAITLNSKKTRQIADQKISCLAANFEKHRIVTGGPHPEICVWDINDFHKPIKTLYSPGRTTTALAISSDAEYLVTGGGDHKLHVLHIERDQTLKSVKSHENMIKTLIISNDQKRLYSSAFDGKVKEWRFPFGDFLNNIHSSSSEIYKIDLGENDSRLLCIGADQDLSVYKLPSGQKHRNISLPDSTIITMAAAQDFPVVAIYDSNHTIRIFNYDSGKEFINFKPFTSHRVTNLEISHDGQHLVCVQNNGDFHIYNTASGRHLGSYTDQGTRVSGISLNKTFETAVVSFLNGQISLFDLSSIDLINHIPLHDAPPNLIEKIQEKMTLHDIAKSEKAWLKIILEMLRWQQRFEIQLSENNHMQIGEFDILI